MGVGQSWVYNHLHLSAPFPIPEAVMSADNEYAQTAELLLLFVARRQDMKPVAKTLIQRFGSFKNVLDASGWSR